ncbi:MAG: DUF5666 domain-containing protein [Hydrogenophaga sp.]
MNNRPRNYLLRLAGLFTTLALLASCGHRSAGLITANEPLPACANASLSNPISGGGVGGTGAPRVASTDPGGIGGTGQVAVEGGFGGTGIVGVVTGFGSICVNGLKVDYESDTAVWRDGVSANTDVLAVGQVVVLQTIPRRQGLSAQRIDVLDAVVGPVSALNWETGHIALVGQIAQAQEPSDLVGLAVGDWARVSGLVLASGEIRATRVQKATPGTALLRGKVSELNGTTFRIGATRINGSRLRWLSDLAEGQEVLLRGQWDGAIFAASAGTREPTKTLIQRSQDVVLEGYVQRIRGQNVDLDYAQLTLATGVKVRDGRLADLRVGQKVQVRGRIEAGSRVTVDSLAYLRETRRGEGSRQRAATSAVSNDNLGSGDGSDASGSDDSGDSDDSGGSESGAKSSSESSGSGSGQGRGRGRGRGGDSSGSGSSGSGSSGSGSSGGDSGSGSSGSGSSGSGSSGSDSGGRGRGRGRGGSGGD